MIGRKFILVQKSVAMIRVKDPSPFRVIGCYADADVVELIMQDCLLELDTNAVAVFEWDLWHGVFWKCGYVKIAGTKRQDAGPGIFNSDQLRLSISQRLSDHLTACCLESVAKACSPAKEVPS